MATTQRPSPSDLNTELFVADVVPGQVRELQRKLRELEEARSRYTRTLHLLVQFAVAQGVELFPAASALPPRGDGSASQPLTNSNAVSPGGTDGVAQPNRGGN